MDTFQRLHRIECFWTCSCLVGKVRRKQKGKWFDRIARKDEETYHIRFMVSYKSLVYVCVGSEHGRLPGSRFDFFAVEMTDGRLLH